MLLQCKEEESHWAYLLLMNVLLSLCPCTVCMWHPASGDGALKEGFMDSSNSKLTSQV